MLPRTDQFIELNDGEIEIAGLVTPQDLVWYLLKALREFLSVAACLERDANGNYIVRDRRAGTLPSVTGAWTRVHTAAQLVLASTLVQANSSPELDGVVKAALRSSTPSSRPLKKCC